MLESMDWKTVAAVLATLFVIASIIPYWIGMWRGETKPHAYTWLIWALTQGTAAAALWYGDGGLAAIGVGLGATLVFITFLFSFKYGTKNVTRGDTVILVSALIAIVVWWQFDQPLLSVLMVSVIDALGYLPTYRKLWKEPWSENLPAWVLGTLFGLTSLAAITDYNVLTVTYVATITTANAFLVALLLIRRRSIPKPN